MNRIQEDFKDKLRVVGTTPEYFQDILHNNSVYREEIARLKAVISDLRIALGWIGDPPENMKIQDLRAVANDALKFEEGKVTKE